MLIGGGSVLSRHEEAEARAEAEAEFEIGEGNSRKGTGKAWKKKKKRGLDGLSADIDELGSLFGDGLSGRLPRFANRITLKVGFLVYPTPRAYIFFTYEFSVLPCF